jgi:DnaJ family protein A protein 2
MPKETKLYDLLEVSPTATEDEIKKAFRKAAVKYHPDRNPGNEEAEHKFKEINNAYEILLDKRKRQLYDQLGQEGLEAGGPPGGGFGFPGFGGGRHGPPRTEDVPFKLGVGLEDLYNGKTVRIKVTRKRTCVECLGRGTKDPKIEGGPCKTCSGQGRIVKMLRMGNMVQQMVSDCGACHGTGEAPIKPEDACTMCRGQKTLAQPKELEVNMRPGMRPGQRIVFHGEADEAPGAEAGDVVVTLVLEPEEVRARKRREPASALRPAFALMGDSLTNLVVEREIELVEALLGWSYTFEHFDGRVVTVMSPENAPTSTGDLIVVPGEGMPKVGNPTQRGDLYLKMKVRMPRDLSPDVRAQLQALLPAPAPAPAAAARPDATVVEGGVFSQAAARRLEQQQQEDEAAVQMQEEEEGRGQQGPGVQCAQA